MPNFAFYGGLVWEGMKSVCFGGGGMGAMMRSIASEKLMIVYLLQLFNKYSVKKK